ncbi:MAG: VWA domain-containing protein, partial [Eubacterium sp.]|nr:VWA domain-containing protein [Eubacterium sp.]
MKKSNSAMIVGIIFAVIIVLMIGIFAVFKSSSGGKTTDSMLKHIKVTKADPVKAPISLDDNTLYDELPEIAKYPVAVQGSGKLDVEIFTSGEKAGKDNDSWLIDVAERFNNAGNEIDGMSVSMTVRSVPSGTAADYIISGKYLPDIYTPSNTLFGEYAIVNGGNLELHTDRLVGNTAGILVKKGAYTEFSDVISAVQSG